MTEATTILLVCNPGDRAEVEDMLREGGMGPVLWQQGDDRALASFEQVEPEVTIVCANLDAGDPRALITSMRDAPHGRVAKLILIGQNDGPIRNALDASDFAVDRFLARPLAANALLYAVRSCARAVNEARAGSSRPASKPAARSPDGASHKVESAMNEAINDFVRSAMDALPAKDARPAEGKPRRQRTARSTLVATPPPPVPPPGPAPRAPEPAPEREEAPAALAGTGEPRGGVAVQAPDAPAAAPAEETSGEPRPSGGAFARELRRKMSDMAERLFPGQRLKESVHAGPAHDHASDIDLSSFGMDTVTGVDDEDTVFDRLPRTVAQRQDSEDEDTGLELAEAAAGSAPSGRDARREAPAPTASSPAPAAAPAPMPSAPASAPSIEVTGAGELADDLPPRGDIRRGEADAAILIERMYRRRFTGKLELRRDDAGKEILFDKGRPVFASSSLAHDRMGELLMREGKITPEQYEHVHALVARTGRRMGEVLIELGWLKRRELLPVVRRHIEDIVYSLFAWDAGTYAAIEGDFAAGERIRISRHPAAMILEGVRRKFDGETLEALIGSPESIVEIIDDRKLKTVVSVADLTSAERKVMASFDGERTLADIHEAVSIDLVEVYQLAYGLVVWGAAQSLRRGDEGKLVAGDEPVLIGETDPAIDRQRVMAKYALVVEADYFSLLGVRRDATSFEIKRAYEAARRDYAGEGFPPEVRGELGTEIAEIGEVLEEAYQVLRDDSMRASYLANLRD